MKTLITALFLAATAAAGDIVIKKPAEQYTDSCRTVERNSNYTKQCDDLWYNLAKYARSNGFKNVEEYITQILWDEIEYQEQTNHIKGGK